MQIGNLTLKHCRYGWMLFSGPFIGKCFDLYGQYSESEVAMMRRFLRPGSTVVDVGANIGDLTLPLATMVGDAGKVFAIESHPAMFNVLCANLALNQIRNTAPINAFVATSPDADTSSPVWGKYAYVGDRWKPRMVALDDLELDALDFVKVDVDGRELDVLQSGAMRIERFRPTLYFENDTKEASAALLSYVMRDLGYAAYWHPAPIFDEDNYFGNRDNHWAPKNIVSLMVLAVPEEKSIEVQGLTRIQDPQEWWPVR
jgi:FkbM family methyltransferase